VILGDVYPNGPAAQAGLKTGDIVLALDGKKMENARQFEVNVYGKKIGTKTTLEIMREGKTLAKQVDVIERVDPNFRFFDLISAERNLVPKLGVLCLDLDSDTLAMLPNAPRSPEGIIVAALAADQSPFGEQFAPGDILHALNGRPLKDLKGLREQLKELDYGSAAVFQIERGGRMRYLMLEMD
jgi:serine protease Do